MKSKPQEKGQALIMIALAAVVLFAFASLAIDGSMAFSKKRQAQNAADAAALSAALAKTRDKAWKPTGFASALTNGFNNDITNNEVYVESCVDVTCPGLPANAIKSEYIYVKIIVHVTTYFTRVFGRDHVDQAAQAVARSIPGYYDEIAYGNAVVALKQDGCGVFRGIGGPNNHFETQGGGIFVNTQDNCGFTLKGNTVPVTPSITIAGADQLPYPPVSLPNPSCGSMNATKSGSDMTPGNWTGKFPPSGVTHLQGGVYCIDGDFSLNGNDTLTGTDVVIRMNSGDITWNGNGVLDLSAPTEGPFAGLLIYVPMENKSTIKINGNGGIAITGTILAPSSDIVLLGTAGAKGINSQIVGYTVEYGGDFNGVIQYDDSKNINLQIPPRVKLIN